MGKPGEGYEPGVIFVYFNDNITDDEANNFFILYGFNERIETLNLDEKRRYDDLKTVSLKVKNGEELLWECYLNFLKLDIIHDAYVNMYVTFDD